MTNLTKPEQVDSSPSTATATDAQTIPVAPSNDPPVDAQELEWKRSLKNLEHHIDTYKTRGRGGGVLEQDAEEVAKAMDQVADSHSDPKVKSHWRDKARAFRAADADQRDDILKEIGKGFLILLTTPFLLVGAVLQAAGGILNGVGTILKGLGRLTRKLSYTGSSNGKAREESVRAST